MREKTLHDEVTKRYKNDLATLNGPYKKYLADVYKERYELIREKLGSEEIITEPKIFSYLTDIASEIFKSNPSLNAAETRIIFSKAWWPNASSMGEGTILFNIGLFHRLENESQVAFTLCHELAHYYLDHGNSQIRAYVHSLYSDEMQKELKSINKSGYRQNQQIESLAKNLGFKHRRHSRADEKAADSMAIEFMKNTNFDLRGSLECLALLDSVDQDKYCSPLNLEKRFDFSSFKFKNKWIVSDALAFTTANEKNNAETDSLKTHPDCGTRIKNISGSVNKYNQKGNKFFIVDEMLFRQLKNQFDFDIIGFLFDKNNVSKSLFYTLQMLNSFPDNTQLHIRVGMCLNEIYGKQKNHQLGQIVELPSPLHNDEYNKLLYLIQNTRLYEIASLSYYYLLQNQAVCEKDPAFSSVWAKSKENFLLN